ncbi:MAG TPA: hypothetical protein VM941_08145 [Pyrinomonadaceae bacterium]|jgi:hypothetical protein|nr:hypothetical protein [Pyrinomonadaceae bacterium]
MPILTNYRPNFCCECGAKIVRLRWFVWTSRRFCDKCFRALARVHWLRPSLTIVAFIVFGVLVGRGCRRAPPPLIIERTVNTTSAAASGPNATNAGASQSSTGTPETNSATAQSSATEQIYTCGARTKKGTPCSRRVHGPVRCWQHKGAKAMLPPEKLLVKE